MKATRPTRGQSELFRSARIPFSTSYTADGRCHNAEPGTFGHECGKPASWIGRQPSGFRSGFCDDCKQRGWERTDFNVWIKVNPQPE